MRNAKVFAWLRRRAEDAAVAMLVIMFAVFLIQIASRYVLNMPIGWTHEISVVLWIWLVLFGASFVIRDDEEMRFDLVYGAVGDGARRVMALVTALALTILFIAALPATVDYVLFMRVEKSAYLHLRFDWLYGIYIVFAVAMIARHLWVGWTAIYGRGPSAYDPVKASSGV